MRLKLSVITVRKKESIKTNTKPITIRYVFNQLKIKVE